MLLTWVMKKGNSDAFP